MKNSLLELHQQRGRLRERIASQRATLAQQLVPLQNASDAGQRIVSLVRGGVQYLKSHPLPVLLALSALVLLKPRRALRWAGRGVALWRSWRALRAWVPSSLLGRWLR
ncbi:MAG: YqjK family protein [Polaromonas sp.]|jgi:hypothetical protein|nr:YqjK family protein [Polaromonas sp.]